MLVYTNFIVFIFLNLGHFHFVSSNTVENEVEVSLTVLGESITVPEDEYVKERTVKFINLFANETISLYWAASVPEKDVFISKILPHEDCSMATYYTHSFYTLVGDPINQLRAYPGTVEIKKIDYQSYSFGPDPPSYVKGRLHPNVKYMDIQTSALGVRFKSLVPYPIDIWYDDGLSGSYQGSLTLTKETNTVAYIDQNFYFTEKGSKKEFTRHIIVADKSLYIVEDKNQPAPTSIQNQIDREIKFRQEYKDRTGRPWKHYFGPEGPRLPPKLHMWTTPEIGFVHKTSSSHGFWICNEPDLLCHTTKQIDLELEVISTEPKVFFIKNFFSEFEAEEIKNLAFDELQESRVGVKEVGTLTSITRTSRSAWLDRDDSQILDTIFKRTGDLLKIDERLLTYRYNAEKLQVVRYEKGQKFDPHHDWTIRNVPESRYVTLLLYLSNQSSPNAGGETSFPKAGDGRGIKIHAGKGNAILFYNILEDGNADELSIHGGLPVLDGDKWVCNIWIWDPIFSH